MPACAPRYARRASSSPEMISRSTPHCARTVATKSAPLGAIRRPAVPTAAIVGDTFPTGLLGHADDGRRCPLHRFRVEPAGLLEPVAESGRLGAVDDRAPVAVGAAFADVELHRVRADVDDGVPLRAEPDQGLEPAREAHVRPRGQPAPLRSVAITSAGSSDSIAKVRVAACAVRTSVSSARQSSIVYRSRRLCTSTARRSGCGLHHVVQELRERVRRPGRPGRRVHPERQEHGVDVGRGQREPGLHHRHPLLEPVVVHRHEVLDVHQVVADLDRVGAPHGQQVDLVAVCTRSGEPRPRSTRGRRGTRRSCATPSGGRSRVAPSDHPRAHDRASSGRPHG